VSLRYLRSLTGFERDARLFLVATFVGGAAISLYWVDFNLYLRSLGLSTALIGVVATVTSASGMLVALPASRLSDVLGRRFVLLAGSVLQAAAFVGLVVFTAPAAILLLAACYAAGQQSIQVVSAPFLAEHSTPEQRNELFSVQFAIMSATNVGAALLGGFIANVVADQAGFAPGSPETFRVILLMMAALGIVAVLVTLRLRDDRPRTPAIVRTGVRRAPATEVGHPDAGARAGAGRRPSRVRIGRFVPIANPGRLARLLFPNFLIAVGAGQVIPFLNLFVERKFGLQLASLNALFALTSLGTMVAILLQPALARRCGKIGSVVLVQGTSIPFLLVLGFSPVFWTVALAMMVRNSLMNAGNPIFNAFAMEHVDPSERATLSAAMGLLWSLGWVIAGPWYSLLQSTLGFDGGYAVNFITIIVLYSIGTGLTWHWFGRPEHAEHAAARRAEARGAS
jgi:MFS family permease